MGARMLNRRQRYGKDSEAMAVKYLKRRGYKILIRNYRTRLGEIDIVARERDTLVFVEVKARHSERYGNPKAALTPAKQRKISMVALQYLKDTSQTKSRARFDVIAIRSQETGPDIEIIKNAFELAYP